MSKQMTELQEQAGWTYNYQPETLVPTRQPSREEVERCRTRRRIEDIKLAVDLEEQWAEVWD